MTKKIVIDSVLFEVIRGGMRCSCGSLNCSLHAHDDIVEVRCACGLEWEIKPPKICPATYGELKCLKEYGHAGPHTSDIATWTENSFKIR